MGGGIVEKKEKKKETDEGWEKIGQKEEMAEQEGNGKGYSGKKKEKKKET